MSDIYMPMKVCPECKEIVMADSPCHRCGAAAAKPAAKRDYLYGARDTTTGKLVSDITNPRRKYWDKKGNAEKAIDFYNQTRGLRGYNKNKGDHGPLELVTFELVEVKE